MASYVRIVDIPNRDSTSTVEVDTGTPSTGSGWTAKDMQVIADRQGKAVAVLFDDTPGGKGIFNVEAEPIAEAAVTWRYVFTCNVRLTKLGLFAAVAPASELGTVVITLKKNGATTVLTTANFDTTTLGFETYEALTLVADEDTREFTAGEFLEIVHTASNADMTGGMGFIVAGEYEFI